MYQVKASMFIKDGELEKVQQAFELDLSLLFQHLVRFSTHQLSECNPSTFTVVHNFDDETLVLECNTPAKLKLRVEVEYSGTQNDQWDYDVSYYNPRVASGTYTELYRADVKYEFAGKFIQFSNIVKFDD